MDPGVISESVSRTRDAERGETESYERQRMNRRFGGTEGGPWVRRGRYAALGRGGVEQETLISAKTLQNTFRDPGKTGIKCTTKHNRRARFKEAGPRRETS